MLCAGPGRKPEVLGLPVGVLRVVYDRSCFSGELRGLWVRICGVGDWLGPCLRGEPWARHRCAGLGRARLGMFMAVPGSPGAVASGAQADFDPQGG